MRLRLGPRLNAIFLVKNYEDATSIKDDVDAPILCALRQIIRDGETFLNQERNRAALSCPDEHVNAVLHPAGAPSGPAQPAVPGTTGESRRGLEQAWEPELFEVFSASSFSNHTEQG